MYVLQVGSGEPVRLTDGPEEEFDPDLSPDGTTLMAGAAPNSSVRPGEWIVFRRDLDGRWALMQIRPDGTGERQVAEEGVFATWDPADFISWGSADPD